MALGYRRGEIKERVRAEWRGACNVTLPSFTSDFSPCSKMRIRSLDLLKQTSFVLMHDENLSAKTSRRFLPRTWPDAFGLSWLLTTWLRRYCTSVLSSSVSANWICRSRYRLPSKRTGTLSTSSWSSCGQRRLIRRQVIRNMQRPHS